MFFRIKKSGPRAYVQVVENNRVDGAVRQSVIANLGRADDLIASGAHSDDRDHSLRSIACRVRS
jgi:hypothetical protein